MTRIAHTYRLPVSTVYAWDHADLVAAVASVAVDAERCPGCGLTETDAWWVAAELIQCPTCEDRDRIQASVSDMKQPYGVRAGFESLTTADESLMESSAARYTLEGAQTRAKYRRQRRV